MNNLKRTVTFTPLARTAEAKENETILDVARRVGAPIGNSCGAIGVCARCTVRVVSGAENLSPPTALEQRRALPGDQRFACQAAVNGPCEVTTTYW